MCSFFSLVSDGEKVYYFDSVVREEIIKCKLKYDSTDSHTSIADYYKLNEDKLNKYEYNPFTKELKTDQLNTTDDSERVKVICNRLDFKKIVPELIIKPIINPFDIDKKTVTKTDLNYLKQWAQVWDQVWDQVRAQVGDQVGDQVWDQVWVQVRAQVGVQVRAYISSFFNIKYKHDYSSGIKLWGRGLVATFYDDKWHLHNKEKVLWEGVS